MATFSQIVNNTASVTLQVDDVTVTIKYYPRRLTQKVLLRLNSLTQDQSALEASFSAINDVLVTLISSWDLYEDDEHTVMVPIETNRLAEFPFDLLVQIAQAITGTDRPETMALQTQTQS